MVDIAVLLVFGQVVKRALRRALRRVAAHLDQNGLLAQVQVALVRAAVEGIGLAVVAAALVTVHCARIHHTEHGAEGTEEGLVEGLLAAAHAHVEEIADVRVGEAIVGARRTREVRDAGHIERGFEGHGGNLLLLLLGTHRRLGHQRAQLLALISVSYRVEVKTGRLQIARLAAVGLYWLALAGGVGEHGAYGAHTRLDLAAQELGRVGQELVAVALVVDVAQVAVAEQECARLGHCERAAGRVGLNGLLLRDGGLEDGC